MALSNRVQDNHILLDEYKLYKDWTDDTSKDVKLNLFLYSVDDFLQSMYGIVLNDSNIYTENFIVDNFNKIFIPYTPFTIQSISYNNKSVDLNNVIIDNHYVYEKNKLFAPNTQVSVTFTKGWNDIEKIPISVKQAVFILADYLLEKVENNANITSSFTDPLSGRAVLLKKIPDEVKLLLFPYRVINV